jgi:lipopolysaccharide transport system ATP-binding protein
MSDIAIRVESLGKRYRIGKRDRYRTLRDTVTDGLSAPFRWARTLASNSPSDDTDACKDLFWALKDVSFDVHQGSVVGVIGPNGAGKSTLLKVLSRITEPTEGRVEIRGRVGSLLEVGTGFHPELTGRENVFLNGAILGMRRAEITENFDEIVAFAELDKFIDTPVKRYSSGMYMRLAFAVAAHLEPEILIVDEVLAVGDAQFQSKCLGKMGAVAKAGRTVLFVSHNLPAVSNLCNRALLLSEGCLAAQGSVSECVRSYLAPQTYESPSGNGPIATSHDGTLELLGVEYLDESGQPGARIVSGCNLTIRLRLRTIRRIGASSIFIGIDATEARRVCLLSSEMVGQPIVIDAGCVAVRCHIPRLPLVPGTYSLAIEINGPAGKLLWKYSDVIINVESGDFYESGKLMQGSWMGSTLFDHSFDTETLDVAAAH